MLPVSKGVIDIMNTNWNRTDLKTRGRKTFQQNYWFCVLASFVLHLGVSGSGITISSSDVGGRFVLGTGFVGLMLTIFLFNALTVGSSWFYFKNLNDPNTGVSTLAKPFETNYLNITKTMFFRGLYTFLWSLLFFFPGVVKYYEYILVPYLIAENPDMDTDEAFRESRRLMDGNKWNAFILDLSFIGWDILSLCTLTLLGIFYVNPYKDATHAALYESLRYGTPGSFPGSAPTGSWNQTAQNGTQGGAQ